MRVGETDGLGVLHGRVWPVQQRGLGINLVAGDGGDEARHVERGDEHIALADGHVGGIAREPPFAHLFLLPLRGGHDHARGLVGQLDASALVEMEAPAFGGEDIGRDEAAGLVEINVAAVADGVGQRDLVVVAVAIGTIEKLVADFHDAVAVHDDLVGIKPAAAQAGDGGEDLECGPGRVGAADGLVEQGVAVDDVLPRLLADVGRRVAEVVVGLVCEHEHLAGADVERDGGADAVADGLLGDLLEVDVEGCHQVLALHGQAFFEGRVDFVASGIDAEDRAAGLALELGIEDLLQPVAAEGALILKVLRSSPGKSSAPMSFSTPT